MPERIKSFGRYNGFCFRTIESEHVILTSGSGSVKSDILASKPHGFEDVLSHIFNEDGVVIAKPSHTDKIDVFTSSKAVTGTICNADGLLQACQEGEQMTTMALNTGDCPIMFIEGENINGYRIAGLIHSGWKGTKLNIIGQTIDYVRHLRMPTENLRIGLWSGICPDCYQVGEEVFDNLKEHDKHFQVSGHKKWNLNLANVIMSQLQKAGIGEAQIEQSGICSHCYSNNGSYPFFSARRGESKRNGVFMRG